MSARRWPRAPRLLLHKYLGWNAVAETAENVSSCFVVFTVNGPQQRLRGVNCNILGWRFLAGSAAICGASCACPLWLLLLCLCLSGGRSRCGRCDRASLTSAIRSGRARGSKSSGWRDVDVGIAVVRSGRWRHGDGGTHGVGCSRL